MAKKIPSILLIGVGRWGENHLRTWIKLQAKGLCRLVGVHDIDHQRLLSVGKEFNIRIFHDNSGIDEADAVDVAVPTYNHFSVVKDALLAGKDVLVEKPFTETVVEAQELERITRTSSQILMVGHLFRYNPAVDYVKKLLLDKEIGNVRFIRGRFLGFRFKESDAGILATTAIHFIYLSNYLMGTTPKTVWAKTNCLLDQKLDDCSIIRLDYDSGFSLIESDYFTPGKTRTLVIVGTQGAILLDALNQKVELHQKKHIFTGGRFEAYNGSVLNSNIEFQEPLYLELKHFLECIENRKKPLTGVSDGIDILRIIEAAYESSRCDKTVMLENQKTTERRQS